MYSIENNNYNNDNDNSNNNNDNLNNQFISSALSTISSNYKPDQEVTNAPPQWYCQLLGSEDEIELFNKTDMDLDYHIFGSADKFDIQPKDFKQGVERPQYYKVLVSIGSQNQLSIRPLTQEVDIIVTYTNDKKEIVKVLSRKSNAGKTFNVFERHMISKEVTTLTLDQFKEQLEKEFPQCTQIAVSEVIKRDTQSNHQ